MAAQAEVRIGDRRLGPGASCYIVAEAGSAHVGDLGRGRELIDAAAAAGADCVKFQVIFADEIVHPLSGSIALPGGSTPIYERFRALEQGPEFYAALQERCRERGVEFLASAFGSRSAALLASLGVRAYKVASPELNHLELLRELRALAGPRRPLILSTGVSRLADIERALAVSGPCSVLLHCITAYPAPEEQYNLRLLGSLAGVFGVPVGVSDHSLDPLLVPGAALLEGACLLEKHITLSRRGAGLDDPIALEPEAFALLVRGLRRLQALEREAARAELESQYGPQRLQRVLGDGVKRLAPAEERFYGSTRRSIHAVGEIPSGRRIQAGDLCIVRSESNLRPGLEPGQLPRAIGAVAQRTIPAGQGVEWDDLIPRAVSEELIQLVDRRGRPAGQAPRRLCHGDPRLRQGVAHLYLFDREGRLYLQRRSQTKDRFPGCWDTSVGGHLAPGETPEQALRREAREELGIELERWQKLPSYLYADEVESEYVFAFRTVHDGPLEPDPVEVAGGSFLTLREIQRRLAADPQQFTRHFRVGFRRLGRRLAQPLERQAGRLEPPSD